MKRILSRRFVLLCIVLLSLVGCSQKKEDICYIKVGQSCVDRAQFVERLERFAEESMITSRDLLDEMKPILVQSLVEEELILEYAREKYITISEEEVDIAMAGYLEGMPSEDVDRILTEEYRNREDIRRFIRKMSLIDKAVNRALKQDIDITNDELMLYYNENQAEFMRQSMVELYHVYVKDQYKAKEALVMLRSGVSLAEVVERYSESGDARDNGFMGVFVKGELPREVEDVVFTIPVKRYSSIVESMRGYHIFYVENRSQAGVVPFAEVREEIYEKIMDKKLEKAYVDWLEKLQAKYKPEVNWDEIKGISVN